MILPRHVLFLVLGNSGSAGPSILRTPEIAGRRLRLEGGLRVAAAREGPRRRRVRGGPQPAQPQRMIGLGCALADGLAAWKLAEARCTELAQRVGSTETAAVLLLQLLKADPGGHPLGRGSEAEEQLPRPGAMEGGPGPLTGPGPAGTARQGGPRQVTLGLVGSYVHTHSVLHLSRVYSARHARLRMWRAREERHLIRVMCSMSRLSCGPGPIDSESGSSFTARQAAFKFEPPGVVVRLVGGKGPGPVLSEHASPRLGSAHGDGPEPARGPGPVGRVAG
jgi:hypothetical protein